MSMKKNILRALSFIFIFCGVTLLLIRDIVISIGMFSIFLGGVFTFFEHTED